MEIYYILNGNLLYIKWASNIYMPIYYVMFMENKAVMAEDCIIPEIPVVPE